MSAFKLDAGKPELCLVPLQSLSPLVPACFDGAIEALCGWVRRDGLAISIAKDWMTPERIAMAAEAFRYGLLKYPPFNWERGLSFSHRERWLASRHRPRQRPGERTATRVPPRGMRGNGNPP